MWRGIFPKDERFFALLLRAAQNGCAGAERLVQLMTHYESPQTAAQTIKEIEHQGDEITHELIRKLDQTFVTPLDREDIHRLAGAVDDVIDFIEAVSDRLVLFKIPQPTHAAIELAQLIHQAMEEICRSVALLGTKGQDLIYKHCIEIKRLEERADQLNREAIARLFEQQSDPISVIKWNEIYEFLEEATDRCEDVANILESIVLKHA
jgi:hypothetical protein